MKIIIQDAIQSVPYDKEATLLIGTHKQVFKVLRDRRGIVTNFGGSLDNLGDFIRDYIKTPKAPSRQKASNLRVGAIYAIKRKNGFEISKLRSVAKGDFGVFQTHEKAPYSAKASRVYLANKEEVAAYLAIPA